MGSFRYQTGRLCNLLARARSVTYSSALGDYPGANAVDGDVGKPWITTGGATESIEADLCAEDYGAMEAFPAGWTANHSGTGAGSADAVNFYAGAKSAKLQAGASGVAQYYIDETVAAGEERQLVSALRITSGSGTVRNRVQCRETGRWLTPSGTWQDSATDVFTSAVTGSWDVKSLTYTVESFKVTGLDTVTLRRFIRCTDNCDANVDGFLSWPTWDVASIHGHNAEPSQAIALYGGTTSPASNLVATLTQPAAQPACYLRATARQTYRYVKILLPAQQVTAFYAGEVVLWQSRVPTWGWLAAPRKHRPYQLVGSTMVGTPRRARLGTPTRSYSLDLQSTDETTESELFGELWLRTLEGLYGGVIIPDDDFTDVVYGRVPAEEFTSTPLVASSIRNFTIPFTEDGLPTIGR